MSKDDLMTIPVVLAGRTYPVLVAEEEVESIQIVQKTLTQEFLDLQSRYANKLNKQDILAMLLLTYAKNLHDEKQSKNLAPVEKRVLSIENILAQAFEN